jgi:hypothetical protein
MNELPWWTEEEIKQEVANASQETRFYWQPPGVLRMIYDCDPPCDIGDRTTRGIHAHRFCPCGSEKVLVVSHIISTRTKSHALLF